MSVDIPIPETPFGVAFGPDHGFDLEDGWSGNLDAYLFWIRLTEDGKPSRRVRALVTREYLEDSIGYTSGPIPADEVKPIKDKITFMIASGGMRQPTGPETSHYADVTLGSGLAN